MPKAGKALAMVVARKFHIEKLIKRDASRSLARSALSIKAFVA